MKKSKNVSVQVIDSDITLLLPNGTEIRQMEPKYSWLRKICLVCFFLAVFGIVVFGYYSPDKVSFFVVRIAYMLKIKCDCENLIY